MKDNFGPSLEALIKDEGGYVNHKEDNGGATKMGVTIGTMRQAGIDLDNDGDVDVDDVRLVDRKVVERVFRDFYWKPIRGDKLPYGIDYVVADGAFHSGINRSVRWLQRALEVKEDGRVGPITIEAARNANPVNIINRILIYRMNFLRNLSDWRHFGRGWSNRVTKVRARAHDMANQDRKPKTFWITFWAFLKTIFKPHQPRKPKP